MAVSIESKISSPGINPDLFKDSIDINNVPVSGEFEQKLTKWKKEPKLIDLKEELKSAESSNRELVRRITEYSDLRKIEGAEKPKKVKGRSAVQPKLVRRQAEWRYSALSEPFLGSNKLFKVEPRTWEDRYSAVSNELLLNYQFDIKIDKVKFIDSYVRTAVDDGSVIVRVGWDRRTHIESQEVPIYNFIAIDDNQQAIEELTQYVNLKTENPNEFLDLPEEIQEAVNFYLENDIPVIAEVVGTEIIDTEIVDENSPAISIVNPANFYVDPSCEGVFDNAKYVIHSFQTCLADLVATGLYENLELIDVKSNSPTNNPEYSTNTPNDFQFLDKARSILTAYEYWGYYDIQGNGELVPITATWIGNVLIRLAESPFPDGKPPFVIVNYMPKTRELFGEADAELLADNQRILGAVTRGMIDLMGRSANAQQTIAKGFLDTKNTERFMRGEDYVNNGNMPPDQAIYQHKFPDVSQTTIAVLEMQNQEAEALTGVKSFSGGMSGNAYGDVAAGIRGILDASSKREMNILRRFAQGIKEIGLKITAMNSVFLSDEEVIRITNESFKRIRKKDLKGHFDLIVDISTPEMDQVQAQELAFMIQTLGNNVDFGITKMILTEIARLRKMPDLAHAIAKFEPQPDPLEEELKQLQLEKAKVEIEEIKSRIALNNAKASETESKSDLLDLNYLEQEGGVKHNRDMEKQKAQAEANQDLAVTKAIADAGKNVYKDQPVLNERLNTENIKRAMGYNALTKAQNKAQDTIDPTRNIGSKYFDATIDPALNPRLNLAR